MIRQIYTKCYPNENIHALGVLLNPAQYEKTFSNDGGGYHYYHKETLEVVCDVLVEKARKQLVEIRDRIDRLVKDNPSVFM